MAHSLVARLPRRPRREAQMTSSRVAQSPMTLRSALSVQAPTVEQLAILPLPGNGSGFRLVGELDLCCVDQLAAALAALPPTADGVVVDLAELEFIDVAGARLLVQHSAAGEGAGLRLDSPSPLVRDVLRLFLDSRLLDTDEVPPDGPIDLPLRLIRSQP
jgi:anti-anti-sigma factor